MGKPPDWQTEAQRVAELLLGAFEESRRLALVTFDKSTDLQQLDVASQAWTAAAEAYDEWFAKYPNGGSVKGKHLPRYAVFGNGLPRMAESLRLSILTLKLVPQARTPEEREELYRAMEMGIDTFHSNRRYVSEGSAVRGFQMMQIANAENGLHQYFRSRLLPTLEAVAGIEVSIESDSS
jgi:hypothetical protein